MWLFTKFGSYSVVQAGRVPASERDRVGDRAYKVRSRIRDDLEVLLSVAMDRELIGPSPKIFDDLGTDYQYRCFLSPEEWQAILSFLGSEQELDYPNFKTRVKQSNKVRALTYGKIWRVLARDLPKEERLNHS